MLLPDIRKKEIKNCETICNKIHKHLKTVIEGENIFENDILNLIGRKAHEKTKYFHDLTVKIRKETLKLIENSLAIENRKLRIKRVNNIESDIIEFGKFLNDFVESAACLLRKNDWDYKVSEINKKVEVLSKKLLNKVKLGEMTALFQQVDSLSKEMVNSLSVISY